jgi:hypothetical protein
MPMLEEIKDLRKKRIYRFLESIIGISTISFLIIVLLLSVSSQFSLVGPTILSIFLIIYSFFWVLKFSLNLIHTIFTYQQTRRWENMDWNKFWLLYPTKKEEAFRLLENLRDKFKDRIGWAKDLNKEISYLKKNTTSKFTNINGIKHIAIFSVVKEPAEVLLRSLQTIYESGYDLDKIVVFVSQEARAGEEFNKKTVEAAKLNPNFQVYLWKERNLDIVYGQSHFGLSYSNQEAVKHLWQNNKLTIIFTQHPDGLIGEIKGKASNEDWGARQASLWLKSRNEDEEMFLTTSFDADSKVCPQFFHNLSYRFATTENRFRSGYQPVHVYANNFFETGMWPRQVASENTLSNMKNMGLEGEAYLFAIYSVPIVTLQEVNFWQREVIAEDSMLFIKCLTLFKGDFKIVPYFGIHEGDAVEADDYFEAISNQYKQLQRWAWGGIENFPYMAYHFFFSPYGKYISLRDRLKHVFLLFSNHFYWATTALLFSAGVVLPQIIGGEVFRQQPISQNLSIFAQYFAWIGYIFAIIYGYITFRFLSYRAMKNYKISIYQTLLLVIQWSFFPIVFGLMSFPALDAQIKGIRGKYLGYWVTPKK